MLIPIFFLNLLLALLLFPFFHSLSQPETFYALTDGKYAFFFWTTLEKALDFLPGAAVLAFSAVFVFLARHKLERKSGFLFFLCLLLAFAVLEPAAVRLKSNLQRGKAESADIFATGAPQAGLIQEAAPSLKMVVLEGGKGQAGDILIAAETSGEGAGQSLRVYSGGDTPSFEPQNPALNPEIARRLEAPVFLKRLSRDTDAVHSMLSAAAGSSIIAYLWTGGAFFALVASFFFLCVLTDWKLINFLFYAFALRALYRFFPLLHGERCVSFLRRFLPQGFSNAAVSALPALALAALLTAIGFALILPRYRKRNLEGGLL